ncbi:TolC family protein [Desulfonatronum lacustre]|uniref:TolC family protein n=1 Tax=Desulfonatronum lacustre TaxID=66849 RepID=UPI00048DE289|nr:TolC family protein [Desulfonatronum lacustre]
MSRKYSPSLPTLSKQVLSGLLVIALTLPPLPILAREAEEIENNAPDATSALILEMEECVQIGLVRNPRIKAAEYAVQRAGSDVHAAFADFLPRIDTGFQARRMRQMRSGLPSTDTEEQENGDSAESDDNDHYDGPAEGEGARMLARALAKNKDDTPLPADPVNPTPVFNPFEELQQQLNQINEGLNQQNQALAGLDENLSNLDENLEELNVKLDDLQEALNKRPLDADSTSFDETVWYARISQPVFTGFTITNTYLRSRLTREMTEAELEYVRLEVARDIRVAFLNVLWAQEDMRSLEARITRLEAQLEAAEAFTRLGMKPYLDVLQAEVDLSEARQDHTQVLNAQRVHTARLLTLMGMPSETPLEVAGRLESFQPDFSLTLHECLAESRNNRPDLFIAHKAVEVAEKDVHLAWGRFAPTASVDFAYNVQDRKYRDREVAERYDYSDRQYWTLGLNVSMNLFEGGRSRAMVMRARHELFRIREDMLHHEMQAAYEVESAYLVLHEAQQRIDSTVKVRAAAQEAYDMALVRYRTEIGTQTELLDAQERLARSETNTNQARAQYNRARAQLYFAMGWLESHPTPQTQQAQQTQ